MRRVGGATLYVDLEGLGVCPVASSNEADKKECCEDLAATLRKMAAMVDRIALAPDPTAAAPSRQASKSAPVHASSGMSKRKFYRQVRTFEFISESEFTGDEDANALLYAAKEGADSMRELHVHVEELNAYEAAKVLAAQDSDPEFFGLDEDGSPLDEEDEQD